ncbi:MAG: prepilin-type N-terminal cleavage/methylation domain-containing protein [Kordiimonadaceae bacterium]|nr:prepilin-type N-terminal cleavage/methylation domain-containing protein [Kordiimonadaceae bacterium]MBO6568580.1 prepilin-type N-terminal cleavage/methylation domain-containing protein [Kordiimonadaceae bacterium]MBO6965465.1 prepilin-type N-terminal cleavage/methylation domain-containing protein [Kordiimonadaceae bacterium]
MFPASIRGGDAGFTLLELLVVLAILSMVIAAAPTLYSAALPSFKVRQFANDVANAGRFLRERARSEGIEGALMVNEDLNLISTDALVLEMPDDVDVTFAPHVAYGRSSDDAVQFYTTGLNSGGVVSITRRGLTVDVTFDWITGSIEVQQ